MPRVPTSDQLGRLKLNKDATPFESAQTPAGAFGGLQAQALQKLAGDVQSVANTIQKSRDKTDAMNVLEAMEGVEEETHKFMSIGDNALLSNPGDDMEKMFNDAEVGLNRIKEKYAKDLRPSARRAFHLKFENFASVQKGLVVTTIRNLDKQRVEKNVFTQSANFLKDSGNLINTYNDESAVAQATLGIHNAPGAMLGIGMGPETEDGQSAGTLADEAAQEENPALAAAKWMKAAFDLKSNEYKNTIGAILQEDEARRDREYERVRAEGQIQMLENLKFENPAAGQEYLKLIWEEVPPKARNEYQEIFTKKVNKAEAVTSALAIQTKIQERRKSAALVEESHTAADSTAEDTGEPTIAPEEKVMRTIASIQEPKDIFGPREKSTADFYDVEIHDNDARGEWQGQIGVLDEMLESGKIDQKHYDLMADAFDDFLSEREQENSKYILENLAHYRALIDKKTPGWDLDDIPLKVRIEFMNSDVWDLMENRFENVHSEHPVQPIWNRSWELLEDMFDPSFAPKFMEADLDRFYEAKLISRDQLELAQYFQEQLRNGQTLDPSVAQLIDTAKKATRIGDAQTDFDPYNMNGPIKIDPNNPDDQQKIIDLYGSVENSPSDKPFVIDPRLFNQEIANFLQHEFNRKKGSSKPIVIDMDRFKEHVEKVAVKIMDPNSQIYKKNDPNNFLYPTIMVHGEKADQFHVRKVDDALKLLRKERSNDNIRDILTGIQGTNRSLDEITVEEIAAFIKDSKKRIPRPNEDFGFLGWVGSKVKNLFD